MGLAASKGLDGDPDVLVAVTGLDPMDQHGLSAGQDGPAAVSGPIALVADGGPQGTPERA
jgi:hypothetical protein